MLSLNTVHNMYSQYTWYTQCSSVQKNISEWITDWNANLVSISAATSPAQGSDKSKNSCIFLFYIFYSLVFFPLRFSSVVATQNQEFIILCVVNKKPKRFAWLVRFWESDNLRIRPNFLDSHEVTFLNVRRSSHRVKYSIFGLDVKS